MENGRSDVGVPTGEVTDDPTERHLTNARELLRQALERFDSRQPPEMPIARSDDKQE